MKVKKLYLAVDIWLDLNFCSWKIIYHQRIIRESQLHIKNRNIAETKINMNINFLKYLINLPENLITLTWGALKKILLLLSSLWWDSGVLPSSSSSSSSPLLLLKEQRNSHWAASKARAHTAVIPSTFKSDPSASWVSLVSQGSCIWPWPTSAISQGKHFHG